MEGTLAPDDQLLENYSLPILVQAVAAITAPALVYVSSIAADGVPKVSLADADASSVVAQQGVLVVVADIAQDERGMAFKRTPVRNFNTGGAAVGDPVYLSTVAGAFTLTRPNGTGSGSVTVQVVGRVTVVSATVGEFMADLTTGGPAAGGAVAGTLNFGFIAGGAAGALTLAGIAVGDRIVAVIANDDISGVDTNLTSEFTITGTNTISNSGGTATTGKHLEIFWQKRT